MSKTRVRTNIIHYLSGQSSMAVFGLASSAVLARYMSKADFGTLNYYIAVATIVLPLLDPGATGLYLRLASRQRERIGQYWARTVGLKIYSVPLTAFVLAVYFYFTEPSIGVSYVLVVLYGIAQSMLLSTDIGFRAGELGRSWAIRRTLYEVSYLAMTVAGLAIFGLTGPLQQLFIAFLSIAIGAHWAATNIIKRSNLTWAAFWQQTKKPLLWGEMRALWPFAVSNGLFVFYYRATAIFIERFGTPSELADFRVAFVITISALYVPKAIIWASAPRIALLDEQAEKEKFHLLLQQSADANLFISAIITVGGLIYGQRLIGILFGAKYAHLGWLWWIFDLAMGLFFIQQFCVELLNNLKKERHVVKTLAVGIFILVAVNLALIPYYGALGAAWARLIAGVVMVPINMAALIKLIARKNLHGINLGAFAAANAAAAAVGLALLSMNFWLSLFAFLVCYPGFCVLFRSLPVQFERMALNVLAAITKRAN